MCETCGTEHELDMGIPETPTLTDILTIVLEINAKIDKATSAITNVESQVAPLIEQLSNSPLIKMLGGSKK